MPAVKAVMDLPALLLAWASYEDLPLTEIPPGTDQPVHLSLLHWKIMTSPSLGGVGSISPPPPMSMPVLVGWTLLGEGLWWSVPFSAPIKQKAKGISAEPCKVFTYDAFGFLWLLQVALVGMEAKRPEETLQPGPSLF